MRAMPRCLILGIVSCAYPSPKRHSITLYLALRNGYAIAVVAGDALVNRPLSRFTRLGRESIRCLVPLCDGSGLL